jgi:Domain of Unknown Function (DUF1080)
VRGVDGGRKQIGTIGDPDAVKAAIKVNDWNTYHVIARGQRILQLVNGRLMSVFIDKDAATFAAERLLTLQMHVGDPFKVACKSRESKRRPARRRATMAGDSAAWRPS